MTARRGAHRGGAARRGAGARRRRRRRVRRGRRIGRGLRVRIGHRVNAIGQRRGRQAGVVHRQLERHRAGRCNVHVQRHCIQLAARKRIGLHARYHVVGQRHRHVADARIVLAVAPHRCVGRSLARHVNLRQLGTRAQLLRGEHGVQHVKLQRLRAVGSHHQRRILGKRRGRRGGHDAHGVVPVQNRLIACLVGERVVRVVSVHRSARDNRVVLARHTQICRDGVRARLQRARGRSLNRKLAARVHEVVVVRLAASRRQVVGFASLKRCRCGNRRGFIARSGNSRLAANEARNLHAQLRRSANRYRFSHIRGRQSRLGNGPGNLHRVGGAVVPHKARLQRGNRRVGAGIGGGGTGKREALRSLNARLLGARVHQASNRRRLGNLHALVLGARLHGSAERVSRSPQGISSIGHHLIGHQVGIDHRRSLSNSVLERRHSFLSHPRALGRYIGAVCGNSHASSKLLGIGHRRSQRRTINHGISLGRRVIDVQNQRILAGIRSNVGVNGHRVQLAAFEHELLLTGIGTLGQLHRDATNTRVVLTVIPHALVNRRNAVNCHIGKLVARTKLLQREHRVGKFQRQRLGAVGSNRDSCVVRNRCSRSRSLNTSRVVAVQNGAIARLVRKRVVRVVHIHRYVCKHRVVLTRHAQVSRNRVRGAGVFQACFLRGFERRHGSGQGCCLVLYRCFANCLRAAGKRLSIGNGRSKRIVVSLGNPLGVGQNILAISGNRGTVKQSLRLGDRLGQRANVASLHNLPRKCALRAGVVARAASPSHKRKSLTNRARILAHLGSLDVARHNLNHRRDTSTIANGRNSIRRLLLAGIHKLLSSRRLNFAPLQPIPLIINQITILKTT